MRRYGYYKHRIDPDDLKKMRSYELKDAIRSLEDEIDRMLMLQDMTVKSMAEYARSLENRISALNKEHEELLEKEQI
jgi:two-component sensor histidine kinase